MVRSKFMQVLLVLSLLCALVLAAVPASSAVSFVEYPLPAPASDPGGIVAGPDGNVWFTETAANNIGRITPAGTVTEFPVPTPGSGPQGICLGPDGALWFTESVGNNIGRVTTAGAFTEYAIPTGGSAPIGICAGPDGGLWFTESATDRIGTVTTAGVFTEYPVTAIGGSLYGIAAGGDGNLWFTERTAEQVGRVTTAGAVTEFPLATGTDPTSIALGPDGLMWFCCFGSSEVGKITTSGTITTQPVVGAGSPWAIALGPDHAMWYTDNANTVSRIDLAGAVALYPLTAGSGVNQIATGPDGRVWVTELTTDSIARMTLNAPRVYGINPSTALRGTTVNVTNLVGAGFFKDATAKLSRAGTWDILATGVVSVSDTRITCVLDIPPNAATGLWDLTVTNGDGQTGTLAGAFLVKTPPVPPPPVPPDWFLAEGTSAWGFTTYITIENPNSTRCTAQVTYNTVNGPKAGPDVALPPMSQTTIDPSQVVPDQDFSTVVRCREGKELAVDRTMKWTGPGAPSLEAHSSVSVDAPAKTWYLAEGSSQWGFECWLLIQNPNATAANCTVTYMIEGGDPVSVKHVVPANSRKSFDVSKDIGAKDTSIKVVSDQPVIPERAMYRNNRREGHDSIGTVAPAADYYLAEGTSAWGFTTYVLVQNPNDSQADVTLTYMTPSGPKVQPAFTMPANSRRTVRVNDITPANGYPIDLSNTDFSTKVHGTRPIIAERAMYWGAGTAKGEACHESIGMSAPHVSFYLPDGEAKTGSGDVETWTLVQNPNGEAVTVEISYLSPDGTKNVSFTDRIPANSRKTYNMIDRYTGRAAVMVKSLVASRPVMVERSMYWNGRGAGAETIGRYTD